MDSPVGEEPASEGSEERALYERLVGMEVWGDGPGLLALRTLKNMLIGSIHAKARLVQLGLVVL